MRGVLGNRRALLPSRPGHRRRLVRLGRPPYPDSHEAVCPHRAGTRAGRRGNRKARRGGRAQVQHQITGLGGEEQPEDQQVGGKAPPRDGKREPRLRHEARRPINATFAHDAHTREIVRAGRARCGRQGHRAERAQASRAASAVFEESCPCLSFTCQ